MVCSERCRCVGSWALSMLSLLVVLGPAACDVVFRVPEVLVRHAAASKPVGTSRVNSTRNESQQWAPGSDTLLEVRYEEYFVEHEVSTADARAAARKLNVEDSNPREPRGVRGVQCARRAVLLVARAAGPLLLRATLRGRALPLGAAHLLRGRAPLPPAGRRLCAVRASAQLLLLQEARRDLEGNPVQVYAGKRQRGVAAAAVHAPVGGAPVTTPVSAGLPTPARACLRRLHLPPDNPFPRLHPCNFS